MNSRTLFRARSGLVLLLAAAAGACADGKTTAPVPASLQAEGSAVVEGVVGAAVAPTVVMRDAHGRAVSGVPVTFAIEAGGGSVQQAASTTDVSGRASPGSWKLGTSAGENVLTARATGLTPVTFRVTARPAAATSLVVVAGQDQLGAAAAAVAVPPSVRVADAYGNGVPAVAVVFEVVDGSGSVTGGVQQTDANGVARVGGWTLGASQGENALVARAEGLQPVTFRAQGMVLAAGGRRIQRFAGDGTTCPVSSASCLFTVRVDDGSGQPLVGEPVVWHGGGVTQTAVTDAHGRASLANMVRNAAGAQTQTARLITGDEVTFRYELVQPGGFNMELRFVGSVTAGQQAAFENARQRWMQVITGNLASFALTGSNAVKEGVCGINHPAINEVVDDLLIYVEVVPIDGPGKILGSAGPCLLRGSSNLPILGVMKLDADDLAAMENNGTLRDVILHEMGHVLGVGTLWSIVGLVNGAGGPDPVYTGVRAGPGFVLAGGVLSGGVPVENTGGTGTRDAHWRESLLRTELMTGYISPGANPLSTITIGALMDLGYQVNYGAADGYALPGSGFRTQAFGAGPVVELHEAELPLPSPRRIW